MKNIIQIVILVLIGTPIFAERHSPEFSAEIMGNGKLLHVTDYELFTCNMRRFQRYWRLKIIIFFHEIITVNFSGNTNANKF